MLLPNSIKNYGNAFKPEINDCSIKGNKMIVLNKNENALGEVKEREDEKYTTQEWFDLKHSNLTFLIFSIINSY